VTQPDFLGQSLRGDRDRLESNPGLDPPHARWTRLELPAILLLALALRLWRLDQNGFGLEYYAAAIRSMLGSWHNFFYLAFDPAGFVSVDKPPLAFWIQTASAALVGFRGWSLLVPQAAEGVAAVWLVWRLVRRHFGPAAGRLAALALALMPVSVAVDRSNNTDSCLVLVLLLAAGALTRATETGRRGWLMAAMALVGIGFNVKMLAAFVVLPTFALVYVLGAPVSRRRRLIDGMLGGALLLAVSLVWVLAFDLTPAVERPFAGSSRTNSMLELAVNHNGLQRFLRLRPPRGDGGAGPGTTSQAPAVPPGRQGPGWGDRVPAGPLRLADRHLAAQFAWLLPVALAGVALVARQGPWRLPLAPQPAALLLWGGWLLTYWIVYSAAGGIFHAYYLVTMAPPLAALAGVGLVSLWRAYAQRDRMAHLLPGALLVTAGWEAYLQSASLLGLGEASEGGLRATLIGLAGDWRTWLLAALLVGTVGPAAWLLRHVRDVPLPDRHRRRAGGMVGVGVAALLVLPTAWAVSNLWTGIRGGMVSADLSRLTGRNDRGGWIPARAWGAALTEKLVPFLLANRQGERYLLATSNAFLAAPIIVQTGEAVMAMGGFLGTDPILSPERLERLIADKEVRFFLVGEVPAWAAVGGPAPARRLTEWVRMHGTPVDPAVWRPPLPADASGALPPGGSTPGPPGGRRGFGRGFRAINWELYDLRPDAGLMAGVAG